MESLKVLIIVSCHGSVHKKRHYIITDRQQFQDLSTDKVMTDYHYYTQELFTKIKKTFHSSIDMVIQSCGSYKVVQDLPHLKPGSRVMFVGSATWWLYSTTTQDIVKNVRPDRFDIRGYYDTFLAHLDVFIKPQLAIVGVGIINPANHLRKYLGKPISAQNRHYVMEHYAAHICKNPSCYKYIMNIMDRMEQTSNIEQFKEQNEKFVQDTMSAIFAVTRSNPKIFLGSKTPTKTEIADFAKVANKLLEGRGSPFEIDQSSSLWSIPRQRTIDESKWQKIIDENEKFSKEKDFKSFSNAGIINFAKGWMLKPIKGFNISKPDYGHVLGIIADLETISLRQVD